jgi:Fe-S oxidoreductase/nitrate reductase gamma subunit
MPTREVYWNIEGVWIMYALLGVMGAFFGYGVYRYYRLFALGRSVNRFDNPGERLRYFLIHGIAQGRTLRQRYSGLMHLQFSVGFFILFIGTTVVFIHEDLHVRIMQGQFYLWFQSLTLDVFGLLAIVGVLMAMLKRRGGRPDRLYHPLDPRTALDDGIILGLMLVILVTGFLLEGIRIVATDDPWGDWSPVGKATGLALQGLGMPMGAMLALHRWGWWLHLVLALAWIGYLPFSKLRHIFSSPANIYFRSLQPRGQLGYVDVEKAFEQDPPAVGIGKLADLTWKDRLDTEACTECARCEAACPASRTAKPLSPMLLILDLRNQLLREAGPLMGRERRNRDDQADPPTEDAPGRSNGASDLASAHAAEQAVPLVGGVITDPVLWDCTTCRACMEACPVFIEHVPKIVDMRRHLVMAENRFDPELGRLFDNLEAAGNPWRFPRADRAKWAEGLDVPVLGEGVGIDQVDVLYWVGCAASYDERNQKIARSLAGLLKTAGVRFAILGTRETCTGDPARRAGHEYLFQMLAGENVATLNELGVKTILASCPHCFNTLASEYPQLGGQYVVRHHAEYLAELVRDGRLKPTERLEQSVAYHDPCYLGRYNDIYNQPREVLGAIPGVELKEVRAGCRNKAMCCGAGGAKIFFEEKRGTRINHLRVDQIRAEDPGRIATSCPFCMIMLEDGTRAKGVYDDLPVLDIAECLERSLARRVAGSGPSTSSVD